VKLAVMKFKNAMLVWIYVVQRRKFMDVICAIQKQKKHCLQQQLGLELDEMGIMRCHGRLTNADLDENTKLLPQYERFTTLLISEIQSMQESHILWLRSGRNIGSPKDGHK